MNIERLPTRPARAEGPVLPPKREVKQRIKAETEKYFKGVDLSSGGTTTLDTPDGTLVVKVVLPDPDKIKDNDEKYATATLNGVLKARLAIWKEVGAKTFEQETGRIYSLYGIDNNPELNRQTTVSLNFSEGPKGSRYEDSLYARYEEIAADPIYYPSARFFNIARLVGVLL